MNTYTDPLGRAIAKIAGSNPGAGIDLSFLLFVVCCAGRGQCD